MNVLIFLDIYEWDICLTENRPVLTGFTCIVRLINKSSTLKFNAKIFFIIHFRLLFGYLSIQEKPVHSLIMSHKKCMKPSSFYNISAWSFSFSKVSFVFFFLKKSSFKSFENSKQFTDLISDAPPPISN